MMMCVRFFFFLFLGASLFSLKMEDYESYFQQAKQAYKEKNYSQSIKMYKTLIDKNYENENIFYNLGTAFFLDQKYSLSIWAFHKARQYNPVNQKNLENLSCASKKLSLEEISPKYHFFVFYFLKIVYCLSSNDWLFLSLFFYIIFFLILFLKKYFISVLGHYVRFILFGVTIVFLCSMIFFMIHLYPFYCKEKGVVIFSKQYLMLQPFEKSKQVIPLKEGGLCTILNRSGDWLEIQTDDLHKGWVLNSVCQSLQ